MTKFLNNKKTAVISTETSLTSEVEKSRNLRTITASYVTVVSGISRLRPTSLEMTDCVVW